MEFVAYVYVPAIRDIESRTILHTLRDAGFSISHLGKNDPPKKWAGSIDDAVALVISGTDITNSTFIRDAKRKLGLTLDIHKDTRWTSSTISMSMPDKESLSALCRALSRKVITYASILGISGAGKDQKWDILYMSEDCPVDLKQKIK